MCYFVDSTDVGVILTSAMNLMLDEIEYCWHTVRCGVEGKPQPRYKPSNDDTVVLSGVKERPLLIYGTKSFQ
jgi:hypothetical protein